jgi:hypothetical protein
VPVAHGAAHRSRTASLTASGTWVPPGTVEVRHPFGECRELRTDGGDVEAHAGSLPDRVQDAPVWGRIGA